MSRLPGPPPGVSDDPVHLTASLLNSVAIRLLRRTRETDRAVTTLTAPRASLLSVLVFGGPRSIGALAQIEQVTPPAMTKLVDALEADGLVTRQRSHDDRRVVLVSATPDGMKRLEEGRAARVQTLALMLSELTEDDLDQVGRAMEILRRLV